ncbi:MAG: hypothetical protein ACKVYV_19215 [Limisphaerales bacterium]
MALPLRRALPCLGLLFAATAGAQEFRIVRAELDAGGRPRVQVPGNTNSYFILRRGESVTDVRLPVHVTLGAPGAVMLTDSRRTRDATFLRVQRVPVDAPLDSDGDGIDDLYELLRPTFLNPLDATDAPRDFDGDTVSNLEEYLADTDPAGGFRPTTFMSSPGPNESEVSVNRPTILEFERALKPGTALDTTKIFPQGRRPHAAVARRALRGPEDGNGVLSRAHAGRDARARHRARRPAAG